MSTTYTRKAWFVTATPLSTDMELPAPLTLESKDFDSIPVVRAGN
jgi:hypothetical protein